MDAIATSRARYAFSRTPRESQRWSSAASSPCSRRRCTRGPAAAPVGRRRRPASRASRRREEDDGGRTPPHRRPDVDANPLEARAGPGRAPRPHAAKPARPSERRRTVVSSTNATIFGEFDSSFVSDDVASREPSAVSVSRLTDVSSCARSSARARTACVSHRRASARFISTHAANTPPTPEYRTPARTPPDTRQPRLEVRTPRARVPPRDD